MSKWVFQVTMAIVLGVAGQLFFKEGATRLDVAFSGPYGALWLIWRMLASPWVLLGVVCYGVSTFYWIIVLKEKDLSMVYPMIACGYILVVLFAWLVRHEAISPGRWLGALIISLGVLLISRS